MFLVTPVRSHHCTVKTAPPHQQNSNHVHVWTEPNDLRSHLQTETTLMERVESGNLRAAGCPGAGVLTVIGDV